MPSSLKRVIPAGSLHEQDAPWTKRTKFCTKSALSELDASHTCLTTTRETGREYTCCGHISSSHVATVEFRVSQCLSTPQPPHCHQSTQINKKRKRYGNNFSERTESPIPENSFLLNNPVDIVWENIPQKRRKICSMAPQRIDMVADYLEKGELTGSDEMTSDTFNTFNFWKPVLPDIDAELAGLMGDCMTTDDSPCTPQSEDASFNSFNYWKAPIPLIDLNLMD